LSPAGLARFCPGNVDEDRRPPLARQEPDAALHPLGQLAGDVEPEPRSADSGSLGWIEAEELLEDTVVVGVGYSRALVRDGDPDCELPHDHRNAYGAVGVLQRVVDEIRDDLSEALAVGSHDGPGTRVDDDDAPPVARGETGKNRIENVATVERSNLGIEDVLLYLTRQEDLVEDTRQAL